MEQLRLLWHLQEVELHIKEAEEEEERFPLQRKKLEEALARQDEELRRAQKTIEELEKRRRKLELEVEDLRERVKKSRLRLLEVKTNKEYEAVLNEIEWAEGAISSLEEEILVILEDLDKRRGELEVLKREVQAEKERLSGEMVRLRKRQKELKEKVVQWQKEREEILKEAPSDLLRLYEGLKRKRGYAIALVKDEICQGCHLRIPPQLYNEILKDERIHTCPNCHRILYYERESAT